MLASNFYQNRDIHFRKVALLLTHLGDRSIPRKALTLVGNPVVSTQITKFGKGSWYFNGNTCTIRTPSLGLASRSFSIEFWVMLPESTTINQVIATTYNRPAQIGTFIILRQPSNRILVQNAFGTGVVSSPLVLNRWYFVSVRYAHSIPLVSLFIDNVSQGSSSINITNQSSSFHIGGSQGDSNIGTLWFKGYLESLRVTLDVSRSEMSPKKPFPYS